MVLSSVIGVFLLLGLSESMDLKYSEIQKLLKNRTCFMKDTCSTQLVNSLQIRHCMCDDLCGKYDDCCVDIKSRKHDKEHWKCTRLAGNLSVYVKDRCKSGWKGEEIRSLCESARKETVGLLSETPVSNVVTGVVYKNNYCAICNDEVADMAMWNLKLICPSIKKDDMKNLTELGIIKKLVRDKHNQSWGFQEETFQPCRIFPSPPNPIPENLRFCRNDLISECLPDWSDDDVKRKCATYMGAMYTKVKGYRNVHCAVCNNVSVTNLRCRQPSVAKSSIFKSNAFSLLFDFNTKMGEYVGEDVICEDEERYDFLLKRCVDISCGIPGYKYISGKCVAPSPPLFTTSQPDSSSTPSSKYGRREDERTETPNFEPPERNNNIQQDADTTLDEISTQNYTLSTDSEKSEYPEDFKSCLKVLIFMKEYKILEDGDIFIPKYEQTYNQSYYIFDGKNVMVCGSDKLSKSNRKETFSVYLGYISNIGLGISLMFLVLHFIIFIIVPDLHNICGRNLASLAVALITSYSCFIIGQFKLSRAVCSIVAVVMYYSFLVSFFWMNILAFDVWRTLRMATKNLRVSNGKQWRRFMLYSVYCWVVPAIIAVSSVVLENIDSIPKEYRPAFGMSRCWFSHRRALLIFFAAPVALIMLINITFFLLSARMIVATSNTTAKHQESCNSPKRNFRLYAKLSVLMGLSWVFGLVAGYSGFEGLWFVFVVFNTLQGMFIFFAFSCTRKVRKHLIEKLSTLTKPSVYRSKRLNYATASGSGYQSQCTLNSHLSHRNSSLSQMNPNHISVCQSPT